MEKWKTCFIPLSIKGTAKTEQQQHKKHKRNVHSPEILGTPRRQRVTKDCTMVKQEQENPF